MTLLLRTLTGSRLYGLATPDSDVDIYEVHDILPTRKRNGVLARVEDDIDMKRVDLSTFLRFANNGQPQALEAMFAPAPEFQSALFRFYSGAFRINYAAMDSHYRDVINRLDRDNIKHRRHGIRLALNLATARNFGRFNPVLTTHQAQQVRYMSEEKSGYGGILNSIL